MKKMAILTLILSGLLFANNNKNESSLKDKHIQEQIEKEKKFAKEQMFYKGKNYKLEDSEVDMESVENLPDVENTNKDFDMDHVYD